MNRHRLDRQIGFLVEVDKLKHVVRQTWLADRSRQENDAEHSWHFALMAAILAEHADQGVDVARVIRMALIHDLVEIDAGDTFAYDREGNEGRMARERAAADRIFALLPEDQSAEVRSLWEEFEARETAEARYAAALDRLQPILLNYHTQGAAWQRHGITADRVVARNAHMAEGAPALWAYARGLIRDAVDRGYLDRGSWDG